MTTTDVRVENPPSKPLVLFDGECHFCRRWIERWRQLTGDRVEYATSQDAAPRFPEIPPDRYAQSVLLVEPDGDVRSGANAVFSTLRHSESGHWLARAYEQVPGFAPLAELVYALIARNRYLASRGTRLLWGNDVRVPTYFTARDVFLRSLGVIFLIAFISLWAQLDGLIGSKGISPIRAYLVAAEAQLGGRAALLLPTLCWLNPSDGFLHLLCGAGVLFSLLLLLGLLPATSAAVLCVTYLSLTIAGQTFLSFQWDILLIETGFLAIFFAPWRWRLKGNADAPISSAGLFLLKLLLFKLMFMSGVVKLTSGDPAWWDLTALNYHYETQPLPTVLGWCAHQTPQWLKQISTLLSLAAELVAPFLIWAPRRLRVLGCVMMIALQVAIVVTGNYAFFNLLTIALCLLLVDDATWSRIAKRFRRSSAPQSTATSTRRRVASRIARGVAIAVLVLTFPINAVLIFSAFKPDVITPPWFAAYADVVEPFRIVNGYGLFRVMTKTRPEIVIEGSADGIEWQPYEFKWKPGAVDRAPRWVAPHQPRLDWQIWFAALGSRRENMWFDGLALRLLQNEPTVTALLARNPFAEAPPRYLRAILYDYHFTTVAERRATGAWWKRTELREYLPTVSLER